jgi:hypothetical protein
VNISLEKFCCRKEIGGYVKEKVKKGKEKKRVEKNGHKDVQSIKNNRYLDARHEKKEKREIALLLQIFQVSTREICLKDQSRIRLATRHFTHMHILI